MKQTAAMTPTGFTTILKRRGSSPAFSVAVIERRKSKSTRICTRSGTRSKTSLQRLKYWRHVALRFYRRPKIFLGVVILTAIVEFWQRGDLIIPTLVWRICSGALVASRDQKASRLRERRAARTTAAMLRPLDMPSAREHDDAET